MAPNKQLSRAEAVNKYIDDAGGEVKIAYHLSTPENPLSQFSVRKWRKTGRIPQARWPGLARLTGRDEMVLHRIHKLPA